ncbi:MAG TPA: MFS transporter [Pirellulales bacterium]
MSPLRSDLKAMTADGAAYSLMVGVGETYLPAFVLAVGLGEVAAGLISAIPLLAGAILQLISPWAVERLRSNRKWVVACVIVQALVFVPLLLGAISGKISTFAVFLLASVYWGAGMGGGPAWTTWAATIVPKRIRSTFFARRARLGQVAVLTGFVLGGLTLQLGAAYQQTLWAFALLFLIAGVSRLISATTLMCQSEPEPPRPESPKPMSEIFAKLRTSSEGRILAYLLCCQIGVHISGPFFNPFMLRKLEFSYAAYVTVLACALIAKIVALSFLGRIAAKYGHRNMLYAAAVGIVPVSSLWLISSNFYFLCGVQVISGTVWAAYELASFFVFFESIKAEERTRVLTFFNLGNAAAIVIGSVLGGLLLQYMAKAHHAYLMLFALSSVVRFASLGWLWPLPAFGTRPAVPETALVIPTRILAIRTNSGTLERPLVAGMSDPAPAPVAQPAAKPAPAFARRFFQRKPLAV